MNNSNSGILMENTNNLTMNNMQQTLLEISRQNTELQKIIDNKTIEIEQKEEKFKDELLNLKKNEFILQQQLDKNNNIRDAIQKQLKQKCANQNIYVDLTCFLNKMDVLKEHSENMMISLPVLTSNIKSCSYVNKDSSNLDKIIVDKMGNPVQNNIDLINIDTSLSVVNDENNIYIPVSTILTTNGQDTNDNNKVIDVLKEPFNNTEIEQNKFNFKWISYDLFIVIVLILIILLFIFRK